MTPEEFRAAADVSRETLARLERFAGVLIRWQARINLIGNRSLEDLWRRHMLDSAQLVKFIPPATKIVTDMGSGGGFPGFVIAVIRDTPAEPGRVTHLIESDARKAAFLRQAARQLDVPVTVHNERIEDLAPWPTEIITARALAPLPRLISYAQRFAGDASTPTCLFLKGKRFEEELTEAKKSWNMRVEAFASVTDPTGRVLRIWDISRKQETP